MSTQDQTTKSYTLPLIAQEWGISRKRAWQLYNTSRLPQPDRFIGNMPVWDSIPDKPAEMRRGPKAAIRDK